MAGIAYDTNKPEGSDGLCTIVTKVTDDALEGPCAKESGDGFAGLCEKHYKEYLGTLIRREKVDPVLTLSKQYCVKELNNNVIDFDSNMELEDLRKLIVDSIPLVYL